MEQPITVTELEDFFKKYADLRAEYDKVSAQKTEIYKELTALELRAVDYLQTAHSDKSEYKSVYGTFSFRYDPTVLVPKTTEDKLELLYWLQSRGIDKEYLTFNSISINGLYKKEIEATGNPNLEIPGLRKGQPVLKTSFRRK
jgi:hypothetical protein